MKLYRIHLPAVAATLLAATSTGAQQTDVAGLNERYKDPNLQVEVWADRFESEGREVFDFREEIVASIGIEPGQAIADVGAGTGLYEPLFAAAVGTEGTVYAVDIVPGFIEYIATKAAEQNLTQIMTILGDDRSTGLAEGSVDFVFVCDTYHHFEDHEAMLASIHQALRPGGKFVVVEYERIEPRVEHIRADKAQFTAEIEASGFRFTEEIEIDGMEENYVLHFERL